MHCPNLHELVPPSTTQTGWPWTEGSVPDAAAPARTVWPRVTIVTPSYNQGQFLEETIRSVLLQEYPDLEYMVLDGGSTDQSVDIVRKYEPWLAHWVSEPDRGQSHAIDKGWKRATSEIIAYLNSDDVLAPGAVWRAVTALQAEPAVGLVYGGWQVIDAQGNVIKCESAQEFSMAKLLLGGLIGQPSAFMRREIVKQVGYLDENLHMSMDLDLWVRIALRRQVRPLPHCLSTMRQWGDNKNMAHPERFWPDRLAILDKLYASAGLPAEVRCLRRRLYGYAHGRYGLHLYGLRRIAEARNHLVRAITWDPRLLTNPAVRTHLWRSFLPRWLIVTLSSFWTQRRVAREGS
jgi:glycosyltransferase involved in cell wall biosynthesis